MRFDDRLTTVLAQPAEDAHDRAVRWRQLVELLARARSEIDSDAARRALDEVREQASQVDEQVRAGAARAIAGLRLPFELIAIFAADKLPVAAPVLAAAQLSEEQWRELHRAAGHDVKGFILSLHPEAAASAGEPAKAETRPPAATGTLPTAASAPPPGEDKAIPSISELVARIERLRRARESVAPAPAPPLADTAPAHSGAAAMFRWEASPSGEIRWVQGVPRGALVGRSLVNAADEGFDERVGRAFAIRAPFRDASFVIAREGVLAGEWRVSGVPAFQPADGRFAGYRGVAVRQRASDPIPAAAAEAIPDHDALRELVHEIKTPLNAIIGFAEIIEQQYLGPADHRYRERAGDIVGNARTLLEAIDDLDFAAKLQSGRADPGVAADLATLLTTLEAELQERAGARGARVTVDISGGGACRTNAALAARLVRRFATTLADALAPGERLAFQTAQREGQCVVLANRPRQFEGVAAASMLDAASGTEGIVAHNAAFWLRLVRGLARIAGGDLLADEGQFTLTLPQAAG